MELNDDELRVLINYYENEVEYFKRRLDDVRNDEISNRYDLDLQAAQINRLNRRINTRQSRIEELKNLLTEL